ncbi:MAG: UDP-N-acetylmuramoyl-L-alanyl-D-glutamate--2,6-diaminopimelate ligase [Ignavibacteriales bacterium]|nr:MAG: UDP-N-acetylmuramoyl-L-alanyl-D-glutamate--2,6-diaminopimelate ligase [Ignavibacteriales bacterium]
MELTRLLDDVSAIQVVGEVQRKDVADIVYDSRKVIKNSVFVAIKGYKSDGHKFILDALNKGALAVVTEVNDVIPDEIYNHTNAAKILVRDSRIALAELSDSFYRKPSSRLNLIGITGTNGKTTTSYFIKNILEKAGNKTGLIGTISTIIGDTVIPSSLTTPESNDLNRLFYDMINEGCSAAVMEVSSHSLELKRVHKLEFSTAVFSNITSDHLDFHNTFENYLTAKKILFDTLSVSSNCVYNIDDRNSKAIIADTRAKLFSYGCAENSDFKISDIKYDLKGTTFNLKYSGDVYTLHTGLVGEFNAYNATAAFASTIVSGITPEQAVEGIKTTPQVPGRFQVVSKNLKTVIIDYSHTEDSLRKALQAVRKIVGSDQPVYTVFGCGGNRDKSKRPLMGKVASELSDKIFITSDNPRDEEPLAIIDEIKKGISKNNFRVIENREEAIKSAIESSEDNAVILIAGKGHETYQEIKGKRSHFSDKEIAQKYLGI